MHIGNWLKRSRYEISRHTVALFGENTHYGTGILVDFRGSPVVITCEHVVSQIGGIVYATAGRESVQVGPFHRRAAITSKRFDWACLAVSDVDHFARKTFHPASEILLRDVSVDTACLVQGFPIGHKDVQVGARIDAPRRTARFNSLTYLSLTAPGRVNATLGRFQPRIEWNASNNRSGKTFQALRRDLSPYERGGMSGGPVVLANERILCGMITHAGASDLWYTPLHEILRQLDAQW